MAACTLMDLCDFITDGTHQTPEYCEKGGYLFLSSKDVTSRKIDWNHAKRIPEYLHKELYEHLSPQKNDILLAKNGTTGVAAIVDRDEIFDVYVSLAVLRPKKIVFPLFLYYAINSPNIKKQFDSGLKGIGVPNLHLNVIRNATIQQLPSYEEQIKICRILDNANSIVESRQREIQLLDNLIKARFVEMFGDTILNPFGWDKELLGTVCDVRDGTHDSPQYYDTGFPLVTSKNVTGGKIDLSDCSLICEADYKKINERSNVDIGDILMPMIGTIGNPVIVDIEPRFAIKNVSLIKFKPASKVLNIYIRTLLQSDYFDDAVLGKVRGGTQKFISLGDIRKLEILVPPVNLQNEFAAFVAQIDKSKLSIQKSLDKAQLLFDSLMQKYFG